jgi:hypothetical protein
VPSTPKEAHWPSAEQSASPTAVQLSGGAAAAAAVVIAAAAAAAV